MKHRPTKLPLIYSPHYSIEWNPKHRFPMAKYQLLYERLVSLGLADKDNVFISSPATLSQVELAHTKAYVERFSNGNMTDSELKNLGLLWSEALVRRTFTAVGGSILTCRLAQQFGIACHLAGGTHHAFADHGAGFCVFNDIAIAAKQILESGTAKQVLIIDCDVHQGDGSAEILSSDPRCFTCSLHARTNYPFEKKSSDLDVEIEKDASDEEYLAVLQETLKELEHRVTPDLIIYDGGSDVHNDDRLGHLCLSDEGVRARDRTVISWARSKGVPVACVIGGGYDHNHKELARRHSLLPETANDLYLQELTA